MIETRKYFDPFGGACYLVNARTRQVRHAATGEYPAEEVVTRALKEADSRIRSAARRKGRDEAMRSCGLVKVRGALGGTYWE